MKKFRFLLFIIITFSVWHSCKKDSAKDPCDCKTPVTADFTITETNGFPAWLLEKFEPYDTDTIMFGSTVFTALEEDAQYTWLIGAETLHDPVVQRSGFPKGEAVPITLIVEKEPDQECFPNDDGRDTLVRYVYRAESVCESVIQGNYHGALVSNPQDTFTVHIDNCPPYPEIPNHPNGPLSISNLVRDCIFSSSDFIITYKQAVFWGPRCDAPVGKIKVNDNNYNEIEIQFMYQTGDQKDIEFIFKGIKR